MQKNAQVGSNRRNYATAPLQWPGSRVKRVPPLVCRGNR